MHLHLRTHVRTQTQTIATCPQASAAPVASITEPQHKLLREVLQKYEQLNMDAEGIVSVIIESNDCQRLVREGQFVSTGTREMLVCVRELALVTETYTDTDTDTDIDIDMRWLAREVSLTNQWNGLVVRIGEKRVCWHWIRLAHLVRPALLLGVAGRPAAATAPPRTRTVVAAEEAVASSSESNAGADTTPVIHPDFSEDDGFLGSGGAVDKDVDVDSERAKGVIRALRRTSQRLGDGDDDAHGRAYISHLLQSSLFENLHAFEIFQYDQGR